MSQRKLEKGTETRYFKEAKSKGFGLEFAGNKDSAAVHLALGTWQLNLTGPQLMQRSGYQLCLRIQIEESRAVNELARAKLGLNSAR